MKRLEASIKKGEAFLEDETFSAEKFLADFDAKIYSTEDGYFAGTLSDPGVGIDGDQFSPFFNSKKEVENFIDRHKWEIADLLQVDDFSKELKKFQNKYKI